MKTLVTIFAAFVLISSNCRKEKPDPELYFTCQVNGEKYQPNSCANCLDCTIYQDTIFMLRANRGFETLGIGINDKDGINVGMYILNEVIGRRGDYKFSTTTDDRFFTDATHTGQLQITALDREKRIITGTFSFEAYNPLQQKAMRVTQGRFRLNYRLN